MRDILAEFEMRLEPTLTEFVRKHEAILWH